MIIYMLVTLNSYLRNENADLEDPVRKHLLSLRNGNFFFLFETKLGFCLIFVSTYCTILRTDQKISKHIHYLSPEIVQIE